ncbi:nuclear transport factor 2 family protein [Sphingomonas sp.]|uniref:nuclear transport factor 2 family protein n=1 Tax=Sphingomonas sp. TaxID=28214 RepID=UPI002DD6B404|nr:nuclear transport factor 2 family protein [Sphingomonas sp.]
MASGNVAVVRRLYDAFGRGDVAGVLGAMHADIEWLEAENFPYADGNRYRGPDAVAAGVFARCIGEWDGFAVRMDELIDGDDTVVALGRYEGVNKATGIRMNPQAVHIWTLRDGKIAGFRQRIDTLDVARAIGTA